MNPPAELQLLTMASGQNCTSRNAWPNSACGLGSVTVPPHQNVGPTADTETVPSEGSTAVQVKSCADPASDDTGSSSGSSCPLHPAAYQIGYCASEFG